MGTTLMGRDNVDKSLGWGYPIFGQTHLQWWNCGRDRWHLKSVCHSFTDVVVPCNAATARSWSPRWLLYTPPGQGFDAQVLLFHIVIGWTHHFFGQMLVDPKNKNIFCRGKYEGNLVSSTYSMLQFTAGWRIPVHRRLANLATETEMVAHKWPPFKSKQHWEIWGFRFPLQKGFPVCINIAWNPSIFHLSY